MSFFIYCRIDIEGKQVFFRQSDSGRYRIFILSSGEMTPFRLTAEIPHKDSYVLTADMFGKLQLASVSKDR